ncbi:amidohydrolase [Leifsonia sp. AG29]|uniref:amidohydrolase n=1 Tax=Leifsonia sp. AG29 TaxID=2598860 RepID=UPI00131BB592|nr:amidohydrolase [Leifsonia sp. AG29]
MGALLLSGARLPGGDRRGDGGLVDVIVRDGRIASVSPDDSRGAGRGGALETVVLDGRWLVPGLWDHHVHFTQWAQTAQRLDVSGARSAADAARLVRERVEERPGDDVVVGFGFHDALWPDEPTRELLDAAAGERPVVLIAGDLHCSWLNTAGMRCFAPAASAALLVEDESFALTRILGAADEATQDAWATDAARAAASHGVVGIVDLEYGWNLDTWSRRFAAGFELLRVESGFYGEHREQAAALGLPTGASIDGTRGLLTLGPFKIISDGSMGTRTALCSHEYPDGGHGVANLSPEQLEEHLRFAVEHGLEPAVHAIGDEANRRALDAFERVGAHGRIEHAQLLDAADVRRFAPLGVTASVQPEHAMDDRDTADRLWAGLTGRAFPLADLLAAGARLAFGSDAPVAPLDPWAAIASAVFRAREGREPWHPEQCIPVEAALTASTRGRIASGEPADLAVLEADPFAVGPEELRRMPVAATILAGRFTHDRLR